MKSQLLLIAILTLFLSSTSFATIKGRELLNDCLGKDRSSEQSQNSREFCVGYIAGFLDTYVLTTALHRVDPQNRHFCLGKQGISYRDAIKVTINYLQRNEDRLDESARNLLIRAFAERYPCNDTQKRQYQYKYQNHNQDFQNDDDQRYKDV